MVKNVVKNVIKMNIHVIIFFCDYKCRNNYQNENNQYNDECCYCIMLDDIWIPYAKNMEECTDLFMADLFTKVDIVSLNDGNTKNI